MTVMHLIKNLFRRGGPRSPGILAGSFANDGLPDPTSPPEMLAHADKMRNAALIARSVVAVGKDLFKARCTEETLMPSRASGQCVLSAGGSSAVRPMTHSAAADLSKMLASTVHPALIVHGRTS